MSGNTLKSIALCVPDNCGRLIGKRQPAGRLDEIVGHGMPMPNFHLVTGLENKPLGGMKVTGPHTGFSNGRLMPDPGSRFAVPGEPDTGYFICDAYDASGRIVEQAPRTTLHRQIARLNERALSATMASELEFYLFHDSYDEVAESGFGRLRPYHHRHGDNDLLVSAAALDFTDALVEDLAAAGIAVDQSQGEGGPGQLEVNVTARDPLKSCDHHAVFKHVAKSRARLMGRSVTFMAKPWAEEAGSGGHIHMCLHREGACLLKRGEKPDGVAASFIAGILAYSGDFMLLYMPYANSFRRMRAGTFVPLGGSWGWDNRTCLVRLTGDGEGCRLEFRLPGADANPYFSYAGLIASGLAGVEQELRLPAETTGDATAVSLPLLPRDLTEALQRFEASCVARDALGETVHEHLGALARAELETERAHVTDCDLKRCFETV